ncbi:hypothetical protein SK128_022302 [Halocaridina rubra]|uniref:Sulfotransferase domain-containing protein n=1 Tax=Halocaridina rubra TaxID=373956 RepID=A0AAN8ZW16_HALRR
MSSLSLPVTMEKLSEAEMGDIWARGFLGYSRLVRIKPGDIIMNYLYEHLGTKLYNFQYRKDDIVVLSYPKSGTTWISELIWAMVNPQKVAEEGTTHIHERVFYIDQDIVLPVMEDSPMMEQLQRISPGAKWSDGVALQLAETACQRNRRIMWSHMHLNLLHPHLLETCKAVYIARNPKDVCVSYFHFLRNLESRKGRAFEGEFSMLAEAFMKGDLPYGPYWDHLKQILQKKNHENLHIIFYEDLKADVMGELKKLREFLNLTLTDEELNIARDHASFERMKLRERGGRVFKECLGDFYRKGEVGDWKNLATDDLDERMDAWIAQNSAGLDIEFRYQ